MSLGAMEGMVRRHPWRVAFCIAGAAIVALKLGGLSTAPPGLYVDEASIGYNAWSIAHHGVDEHGNSLPLLYFEAFGEYKNPLYIYMLAPLTWVLPLTPYVERLPAALCGIGVCALVAATAWTLTRSRPVALAALLTAAVTPWLTLETRVGFEVPVMTLTLTLAIWCYARARTGGGPAGVDDVVAQSPPDTSPAAARARRPGRQGASPSWLWGAGVGLALSSYAYSSGRAFVAALVVALIVVDRRWRRLEALPLLAPVAAGYVLLWLYTRAHPGALTNRFDALSIGSDNPGLITEGVRFLRNYVTYYGVPFLFTNGDANLRHSTGYGGVLLVTSVPLVVLGVVHCVRTWRQPVSRLLLAGALLGPVPAALTAEGTPHALRSAAMLPFLLVLMGIGWAQVLPVLTARRLLVAGVGVALAADAGGFMWDLFVGYPGRAVVYFNAGEQSALHVAYEQAGGHRIYISDASDFESQAYIEALFALTPPPVTQPTLNSGASELAAVGVTVLGSVDEIAGAAGPGDIMVLAPGETPPAGSTLLDSEDVTVAPSVVTVGSGDPDRHIALVRVWRR